MITTYKKEFNVAKWSEVKQLHNFESVIKDFTGLWHEKEFINIPYSSDIKRDFDKMREILSNIEADFINFDE